MPPGAHVNFAARAEERQFHWKKVRGTLPKSVVMLSEAKHLWFASVDG
jgi:hypothetical protein